MQGTTAKVGTDEGRPMTTICIGFCGVQRGWNRRSAESDKSCGVLIMFCGLRQGLKSSRVRRRKNTNRIQSWLTTNGQMSWTWFNRQQRNTTQKRPLREQIDEYKEIIWTGRKHSEKEEESEMCSTRWKTERKEPRRSSEKLKMSRKRFRQS